MSFPQGPERIVYAGNTRPLPVPLSRGAVDIGYISTPVTELIERPRTQKVEFTYIPVTHALTDRTFTYRALVSARYNPGAAGAVGAVGGERLVEYDDVRALFLPTNKFRPNLNRGDWYYGRDEIITYLAAQGEAVLGVLFVERSATVRWNGEGLDVAQQLPHIMRPQLSPRDATPVDFHGIYDQSCPDTCDAD